MEQMYAALAIFTESVSPNGGLLSGSPEMTTPGFVMCFGIS